MLKLLFRCMWWWCGQNPRRCNPWSKSEVLIFDFCFDSVFNWSKWTFALAKRLSEVPFLQFGSLFAFLGKLVHFCFNRWGQQKHKLKCSSSDDLKSFASKWCNIDASMVKWWAKQLSMASNVVTTAGCVWQLCFPPPASSHRHRGQLIRSDSRARLTRTFPHPHHDR